MVSIFVRPAALDVVSPKPVTLAASRPDGFHNNLKIAGWWFGCHFWHFPIYWVAIIIPIDELIFSRGVAKNHQGSNHQPDSHWSIGQHLNSTSWEDPLHIFDKSHPCWATQNAGKIRQQFHSRSRCWAQKCRRARAMPRIQSTFAWTFSSSDGDRTLIWLVV